MCSFLIYYIYGVIYYTIAWPHGNMTNICICICIYIYTYILDIVCTHKNVGKVTGENRNHYCLEMIVLVISVRTMSQVKLWKSG